MARFPLRLKLTLWFLTIFAVIYSGVLGVMWVIGRSTQSHLIDEGALSVARSIGQLLVDMDEDFTNFDLRAYQAVDRMFGVLAVRDSSGVAVASDAQVDTRVLPPLPPPGQSYSFYAIQGETARSLIGRVVETRICTYRFQTKRGDTYYIDVARTTDAGHGRLSFFRDSLFIAGLGGLLSSTIAVWILLGRATSPFLQISQVARRLGLEGENRFPALTGGSDVEKLQNDLNEALGRLEEGYRVRQRFLANVAHDLKTPVSVMLTQSQVLEPSRASLEEFKLYRESVIEELRRLRGIIEGILALSRAAEGEALLRRTPVSINSLLAQVTAHCKPEADAARVRLRTTMLNRGDTISGDIDLLCAMLDNLVLNAIRFSPPRESVELRAEIGDNQAHITVRDHGPGIPEEFIDKIFERFAQVPSDKGKGKGGTGLGLAIAKTVAEVHGGSIQVRNRRGGGCAFTVTLPLVAENEKEPSPS